MKKKVKHRTLDQIRKPLMDEMHKAAKDAIQKRLLHFQFHRTRTAESLGISREHLWTLIGQYRLKADERKRK